VSDGDTADGDGAIDADGTAVNSTGVDADVASADGVACGLKLGVEGEELAQPANRAPDTSARAVTLRKRAPCQAN